MFTFTYRLLSLLMLWPLLGLSLREPMGTRLYVKADATGAGDGSSWFDAYPDLQTALATAPSGAEIWVAHGSYLPTTGTDRTATFLLREGVSVYGGFAGTETTLAQRQWRGFPSTLQGDIGVQGDATDDVYHVVTDAGQGGHLDGFYVTGGNPGGSSSSRGACLLSQTEANALTTLANVIFYACGVAPQTPSAVHLAGAASARYTLDYVGFYKNNGYGLLIEGGLVDVRGSVFSGQTGAALGVTHPGTQVAIQYSTFTQNNTIGYAPAGAIDFEGGSISIEASILWGDAQPEVFGNPGYLGSSVVQGGCPAGYSCGVALDLPPGFLDALGPDGTPGTFDDNLRLTDQSSPAFDLAEETCSLLDFDGYPRPEPGGASCDAGAYEWGAEPTGCPLGASEAADDDCEEDPPTTPPDDPAPRTLYFPLVLIP